MFEVIFHGQNYLHYVFKHIHNVFESKNNMIKHMLLHFSKTQYREISTNFVSQMAAILNFGHHIEFLIWVPIKTYMEGIT